MTIRNTLPLRTKANSGYTLLQLHDGITSKSVLTSAVIGINVQCIVYCKSVNMINLLHAALQAMNFD